MYLLTDIEYRHSASLTGLVTTSLDCSSCGGVVESSTETLVHVLRVRWLRDRELRYASEVRDQRDLWAYQ